MQNWALIILAVLLVSCASLISADDHPKEPDSVIAGLLRAHKYHEAMRELPKEMNAWTVYTEETGRTSEGAAGYIYSTTMFRIASEGDSDWGKILDDSNIPYPYKTRLIFEIVEARLGKGAVWAPWHTPIVIIPQSNAVDSWDEVNQLLNHALSEPGASADADKPRR
ncbi:MAG: hypothetical protein QNJ18_19675 [Xenococcaceae cyanobacterium MO_167.B52]|nr:hypothetical protein [Xenococcaceae cyanobacterium MO_167.B52]